MTGEISYRTVETDDYGTIARLSGNAAEWFFMFPRANYPLTAAQPETAVRERHDSTVVLCEGQIAEYADFQEIASGAFCTTGHVVVDPRLRRRGTGTGLIRTMERIAVEKYAAGGGLPVSAQTNRSFRSIRSWDTRLTPSGKEGTNAAGGRRWQN